MLKSSEVGHCAKVRIFSQYFQTCLRVTLVLRWQIDWEIWVERVLDTVSVFPPYLQNRSPTGRTN